MEASLRCKACGFIASAAQFGEVCPACGVKKDLFEPWKDRVGRGRRVWLDLHLHPIVVHIPQTLAVFLLVLGGLYPWVPASWQAGLFWPLILPLSWLYPLSVLGGSLSGAVDGKVRYRKLSTPLLSKKLWVGTLFLVTSTAQTLIVVLAGFGPGQGLAWAGFTVLAAVSLACAAVLGHWGASLFGGAMPGDKVLLGPAKKKAS